MRISDWSSDVCSSDLAGSLSRKKACSSSVRVRPERPKIAGIIVRQPPSVGAPSCGNQGRHDGISLPPDQRAVRRDGPNQRTMTHFSPETRNFPHTLDALAAEPVMTRSRETLLPPTYPPAPERLRPRNSALEDMRGDVPVSIVGERIIKTKTTN